MPDEAARLVETHIERWRKKIRIPYCLKCDNCKENMVCEAYPKGIPEEVLHKAKVEGVICNKQVAFKNRIIEHQNSTRNTTSQK